MTGLLLLRKGHTVTASTLNWRFKTNTILFLAQTFSQFPENTVLIQLLHCTLVHVKYATFIASMLEWGKAISDPFVNAQVLSSTNSSSRQLVSWKVLDRVDVYSNLRLSTWCFNAVIMSNCSQIMNYLSNYAIYRVSLSVNKVWLWKPNHHCSVYKKYCKT